MGVVAGEARTMGGHRQWASCALQGTRACEPGAIDHASHAGRRGWSCQAVGE
jgi:hypothetical protein